MLIDAGTSSDGEVLAASIQDLRLGVVIGATSWGGVLGINDPIEMVDGGSVTVPADGYWTPRSGFGIENRGVVPDVVVDAPPRYDVVKRKDGAEDVQLETAIVRALKVVDGRDMQRGGGGGGGGGRGDAALAGAMGRLQLK